MPGLILTQEGARFPGGEIEVDPGFARLVRQPNARGLLTGAGSGDGGGGGTASNHHLTHQAGGSDELALVDLVGDLPAARISDFGEAVDDRVAALVVAGAGISKTYDDGAGTLTLASTITQYTDELAQDAVGALLVDSITINLTYNDATPSLSADLVDGSVTDTHLAGGSYPSITEVGVLDGLAATGDIVLGGPAKPNYLGGPDGFDAMAYTFASGVYAGEMALVGSAPTGDYNWGEFSFGTHDTLTGVARRTFSCGAVIIAGSMATREFYVYDYQAVGTGYRLRMNASGFVILGNTSAGGSIPAQLSLVSHTTQAGGIALGDAYLHRFASGTLRTPGALDVLGQLTPAGAFRHTGSTFGAFGVAAVARPAALVQTYATADRTHAARTAAALTDNMAGTAGAILAAIPNPADTPATADALRDDLVANVLPKIRDALSSLAAQANAGRADALDTAQLVNALVDDFQLLGFEQ